MRSWNIVFLALFLLTFSPSILAQQETDIPELSTVLALFSATAGPEGIRINWSLDRQSPTIIGFRIYRGYAGVGHFAILRELDPHAANGLRSYAYTDTSAIPGVTYYYKLAGLGQSAESVFPVVISAAVKSEKTDLLFDPGAPVVLLAGTKLELYVREFGRVQLDLLEPEPRALVNDTLAPGVYELELPLATPARFRLSHENGFSKDISWPVE